MFVRWWRRSSADIGVLHGISALEACGIDKTNDKANLEANLVRRCFGINLFSSFRNTSSSSSLAGTSLPCRQPSVPQYRRTINAAISNPYLLCRLRLHLLSLRRLSSDKEKHVVAPLTELTPLLDTWQSMLSIILFSVNHDLALLNARRSAVYHFHFSSLVFWLQKLLKRASFQFKLSRTQKEADNHGHQAT